MDSGAQHPKTGVLLAAPHHSLSSATAGTVEKKYVENQRIIHSVCSNRSNSKTNFLECIKGKYYTKIILCINIFNSQL